MFNLEEERIEDGHTTERQQSAKPFVLNDNLTMLLNSMNKELNIHRTPRGTGRVHFARPDQWGTSSGHWAGRPYPGISHKSLAMIDP